MNENKPSEAQIVAAALRLISSERPEYLQQVCGENFELRARIEKLIDALEVVIDPAIESTVTMVVRPAFVTGFAEERAGDRISRFKLLEKIGEGGMGVVWMAEQSEPIRRFVALKLIKRGMSSKLDSKQILARFEAERQALALMDHPNIAKALDAGATSDGRPFFVMELVKGLSITQYCNQNQLSIRERLELFIPICQAIQHAHQKGIVHRDIKPSNVLVPLYDGKAVPKVIDFGVAKATGQQLTEKTLFTAFGAVIGTLEYMSPEQAELNQLDVDTRSDIYSLGVLLYELLTGTTPLKRENMQRVVLHEVLRRIREEEPPLPSQRLAQSKEHLALLSIQRKLTIRQLSDTIKNDLDWIVMKCLEKDRSRRYESASDMAADLERHLNNEPIVARPSSNFYRFHKFARRNKILFASATVVLFCLISGLAISTWALIRQNQARMKEQLARIEADRQAERAKKSEAAEVTQRRRAERILEQNQLQRAEDFLKSNGCSDALATLAQVLRRNPTNRFAALRIFSILEEHSFALPLAPPLQHEGPVRTAHFSPDGTKVLTASKDGTACIWDAKTGTRLFVLHGHTAGVRTAEFSPDGNLIVTASLDKTAKIWNAHTGDLLRTFEHPTPVAAAHFSPKNDSVVAACYDGSATVWNAHSGKKVSMVAYPIRLTRGPDNIFVSDAFFTPDAEEIVTAWGAAARTWRTLTGEPVSPAMEVPGINFFIFGANLSPDGTKLAVSSDDFITRIWDVKNGALISELHHDSSVGAVAFSPDNELVGTGAWDGTVRIWNLRDTRPIAPPLKHKGMVYAVRFSPDGQFLISASKDKTTCVWDVRSGRQLMEPIRHKSEVYCIDVSPDGSRIITGSKENTALIVDALPGNAMPLKLSQDDRVWHANFTKDAKAIITSQADFTTWVWNASTGALLLGPLRATSKTNESMLASGAQFTSGCSPDGRHIVISDYDGKAQIWDISTGQAVGSPLIHRRRISQSVFSHDGKLILTVSRDTTARLWNAETGEPVGVPFKHDGIVNAGDFSPDDKTVATGSLNGVSLWETSGVSSAPRSFQHSGEVLCLKFSPDKLHIASASLDNSVQIWDAVTGKLVADIRGHDSAVEYIDFNLDGTSLLTCSRDGTAKIWNVRTGKLQAVSLIHASGVYFGKFSPDGTEVVTASADHTARIWDSVTGKPLSDPFEHDGEVCSAEFSPDGKWVVTASADKSSRIWEVPACSETPPTWLPEFAEAVAGQSINESDSFETVGIEKAFSIKHFVSTNADTSGDLAAAQWFMQDRRTRPISPHFLSAKLRPNTDAK